MARVEPCEHRGQDVCSDRLLAAEAHGAARLAGELLERGAPHVDRRERTLGVRQEPLSGAREDGARRRPNHEPRAEIALQLLHTSREARLGHAERACGARESARAGDRDEGPELVGVHGAFARFTMRFSYCRYTDPCPFRIGLRRYIS